MFNHELKKMNSSSTKICRFCLFDDGQDKLRPILNLFSSFEHLPVLKHVQNFLSIDLSPRDSIPPTACQLCIEKIKYASDFLETCQNAEKQLALIFGGPSSMSVKAKSVSSCTTLKFPNGSDSESSLESGKMLKPIKSRKNIRVRSGNKKRKDSLELQRPKSRAAPQSETNCTKCKKMMKSMTELKGHKCISQEKQTFKCPKCEKILPDKLKLIAHGQTHKIPCQICNKPIYPKRLESHLLKHANQFQKKLESISKQKIKVSCEICMKSFRSETFLNRHKVKVHKNNTQRTDRFKIKIRKTVKERKLINCDVCDQAFSSRKQLTAHKIVHIDEHNSDQKQICDVATQNLDQVSNSSKINLPKENNSTCVT